jgi:hypothetical protein
MAALSAPSMTSGMFSRECIIVPTTRRPVQGQVGCPRSGSTSPRIFFGVTCADLGSPSECRPGSQAQRNPNARCAMGFVERPMDCGDNGMGPAPGSQRAVRG